jgi:hypothetical protein
LWAKQALQEQPHFLPALRVAAASNALAERQTEAEKAMIQLREFAPGLRLSNLKEVSPFRRPRDFDKYTDGLRKAGLPE